MDNKSIELRVGLVVTLATVILVTGIIWIRGYKVSLSQYAVKVTFSNVGILEPGDPVAVSGLEKGKVSQLELYQGDILVTFKLSSDVVLKEDASFACRNVGLMGERYIEVTQGKSPDLLDLKKIHRGEFDTGIPEVMGQMGDMIAQVKRLVDNLQANVGSPSSQSSLKKSIINLEKATVDLANLLEANKPKINQTVSDLSYSSKELKEVVLTNKDKLNETLENFNQASERFNQITTSLDSISISLKNLTRKIDSGEGSLGQLVNDRELYDQIKKTSQTLDELIQDIKKNPKKYFKLEIF